jgi:hypothetical protein
MIRILLATGIVFGASAFAVLVYYILIKYGDFE